MTLAKNPELKKYVHSALNILHSYLMDISNLSVTPILAEHENHCIICFYNCPPDDLDRLKVIVNDPKQELQLYYESWSDDDRWVIMRFTPRSKPKFEQMVFKTILAVIDYAIRDCEKEELYEEAALLMELKTTYLV